MGYEEDRRLAGNKGSPLFKFRPFREDVDLDPERQGYAASLLRDNLVYCAAPLDLNDPWEARPAFRIPEDSEVEVFIQEFCALQPERQRQEAAEWVRSKGVEYVCRAMQDSHWHDNRSRSVFSAAGNPLHPLLWSYYADGHKGLCWIFDEKIAPLANAIGVHYEPEAPQITFAEWQKQDMLRLSFLTKADFWKHEDEYRLMLPAGDYPDRFTVVPHNGAGKAPNGRYLKLPANALVGVIFGSGLRKPQRAAIARLCVKFGRNIAMYKAGMQRRRYEMAVVPLAEAEIEALANS